jgi:NAD(P)H-hydrate epimerase
LVEAGPWLAGLLPARRAASHKYDFGFLLIRGGASMTGAGRLAARAALRSGAGLVGLAAPAASLPVYATAAASLILLPAETPDDWIRLLGDARRNALLVGPGNGATAETRAAVEAALASGRATVLDADAITCFAGEAPALAAQVRGPLVVTPHEGEFRRLFPDLRGDKLARARAAARALHGVVLLKGADTVIAAPDGRAAINASGPPALAVGGSGDVLAGILGGLLAQGLPAFEAAALAAWLHGAAAEGAGRGFIADDLPDRLPAVFARLATA